MEMMFTFIMALIGLVVTTMLFLLALAFVAAVIVGILQGFRRHLRK